MPYAPADHRGEAIYVIWGGNKVPYVPRYPGNLRGAGTEGPRAPATSPGSHLLPVMDQKDAFPVHSGEIVIKLGKYFSEGS